MFTVNNQLLHKAQQIFANYHAIYWIIGGACTGKSTISQSIIQRVNIPLYDMDSHIYGDYMPAYQDDRHPTIKAWLSAPNPLAWQLDLSAADFDAFNKSASTEYLDLLADDIQKMPPDQSLLIDGGITHPSLLAAIMPVKRIVCMNTSRAERVKTWETAQDRAEMRQWIHSLPQPDERWQQFLTCDEQINTTLVNEARAHHIKIFERGTPATDAIIGYLGLMTDDR